MSVHRVPHGQTQKARNLWAEPGREHAGRREELEGRQAEADKKTREWAPYRSVIC